MGFPQHISTWEQVNGPIIIRLVKRKWFRLCLKEKFEDTKEVIRIRKSKKKRQHSGQKKKDKQRSTKHTHKTKDQVTRTPL